MKGRPSRTSTTSTPREHKSKSSITNQTTAAIQFSLTPQETRLINDIVQYKDTSMQSLKHPKVQEIIKTRKGRLVKEEEEYANFLSKEFFMGLADIKEGTTKRSYLSMKLTCTKMRISKKFKGEVFVPNMYAISTLLTYFLSRVLSVSKHTNSQAKIMERRCSRGKRNDQIMVERILLKRYICIDNAMSNWKRSLSCQHSPHC